MALDICDRVIVDKSGHKAIVLEIDPDKDRPILVEFEDHQRLRFRQDDLEKIHDD